MQVVTVTKPRRFLKTFLRKFTDNGATDLAAQLAYYFFLSLFPLLLFLLTLLPYFSVDPGPVISFISHHAPKGVGGMITDNVRSVLSQRHGGLLSIGLIATLWSASNGISALMRALNKAYEVKETRSFIKAKALAVALTVGVIIVVLVTLLLPVFGDLIMKVIDSEIHLSPTAMVVYHVLRYLLGIAIMGFVLMFLYRLAPNATFRFKEVFWGAIFATIGWQLISLGFSFYVANFAHYSATYGALGGVIVMLLWFFLTGLMIMIGGLINATLHEMGFYSQDPYSAE